MHPWRSWNDSHPESFSIPKGGRNPSLIVRKRTVPLAISADLSTHLPKVCPDFRKAMSVTIVGEPRQRKSLRDLDRAGTNRDIDRASNSAPTPKTTLRIHSRELTAPAAHSKRLYRKCSGIDLHRNLPSSAERELALIGALPCFLVAQSRSANGGQLAVFCPWMGCWGQQRDYC